MYFGVFLKKPECLVSFSGDVVYVSSDMVTPRY